MGVSGSSGSVSATVPDGVEITSGTLSPTSGAYVNVSVNNNTTTALLAAGTRRLRTVVSNLAGSGGGITWALMNGAAVVTKVRHASTNEVFPCSIDLASVQTAGALTLVTTLVGGGQILDFTLVYEDV